MKNIAIFGASRTGKTTLARMINKNYLNYHIISGDSIRHAFQNELPKNEINKFGGSGMKEDFARFCASLFKNQAKRNKNYFNYIFDSCDVSVTNALKYFKDENTIIVFLGYSKLTPQEALQNYRKFEKSEDWTCSRTDEELLEHAQNWIKNSKVFENDCKINNVKYIDTSYNRDEVLKKLCKELILECEKGNK